MAMNVFVIMWQFLTVVLRILMEKLYMGLVHWAMLKMRKKAILLKPTTYMNLSGESIREVINFYKISNEEVIVIYDDISLEVGRLRIREKGSHGGHNGIKSIIANLGTDVFPRVKIGVGAPKGNLVSHVLGKFSEDEIEILKETIKASSDAVDIILKSDTKEAMNKLNGFNACK